MNEFVCVSFEHHLPASQQRSSVKTRPLTPSSGFQRMSAIIPERVVRPDTNADEIDAIDDDMDDVIDDDEPVVLPKQAPSPSQNKTDGTAKKTVRPRITKSMRAGLILPVTRVHTGLRVKSSSQPNDTPLRVAQAASIEMTAALEIVTRALLQRAFSKMKLDSPAAKHIEEKHLAHVLENDDEISELQDNIAQHKSQHASSGSSSSSSSSSASAVSPSGPKKRQRKADKSSQGASSASSSSTNTRSDAKRLKMEKVRKMLASSVAAQQQPSSTSSSGTSGATSSSSAVPPKRDAQDKGRWEYFDNGWHPYAPAASDLVEAEWQEYVSDPHRRDVRSVKSGQFRYFVDFTLMKQTNVEHPNHTQRDIRRVRI